MREGYAKSLPDRDVARRVERATRTLHDRGYPALASCLRDRYERVIADDLERLVAKLVP